MEVAVDACQSKIVDSVFAMMLPGANVLDLEGKKRRLRLPEQAVLTAIAGALADNPLHGRIHR
jgi:hypothetical protein